MTARYCIKTLNERSASIFLFLLLSGDFVFIVLHFLSFSVLKSPYRLYDIGQDGGYSEMYQYIKFGVAELRDDGSRHRNILKLEVVN